MKRVFADELSGKTVDACELSKDFGRDKRFVLKFTDGTVFILTIEHGFYGEVSLRDDDMERE